MSSTPESPNEGVFDLSEGEGTTASEKLLARLCKKSFLSLWAYPNLHTDEGRKGGVVVADKEFTDVLIVFGNDVVLFSDKHVEFQHDKPIEVAWPRWFKRAVLRSADQLHGALSWLKRFPERVFIDAKCTRPLPIKAPPPTDARYHLIAVIRGSLHACKKRFPASLGTLQIRTDVVGEAHSANPFTVGILDDTKPFVHVLDEFSLEVLLAEFDTAPDFIEYLTARERFLTDSVTKVAAAGEEQLAAAYLRNMDGETHWFLPPPKDQQVPSLLVFDESHFKGLRDTGEYKRKKKADARSYAWDKLIENFIRIGSPKVLHPDSQQPNEETEEALRTIASEGRFRRRLLVESLGGLLTATLKRPNKPRARLLITEQEPELVYVFLVVPKSADEDYDSYRKRRIAMLHAYCRCAKLKAPAGNRFVGIAVDHPVKDYPGGSEDLMVYHCEDLPDQEREKLEKIRKELGILGDDMQMEHVHADEFPAERPDRQISDASEISGGVQERREAHRRRKHKRDIVKASRRRNRRKK